MENKLEFITKTNQSRSLTIYHGGWEKCTSGHAFGPAVRPHFLLHYILSGKGKYYSKNTCYELKAGDGFLIYPGDSTYYKADKDDPWEYCWLSFDGYEVTNILKKCGFSNSNLLLKDTADSTFKNAFFSLIKNYESTSNNEFFLLGQFYLCFSHIIKNDSINEKDYATCYLDKAIDYIYNNFSYDITVSDISKFVGIDRTYLYKLFIKELDISPQQYLITFRLNTAVNMLKSTEMNITEISYSCGFKDVQSFYKHFKKHFNTTPVQYRKNNNIVSTLL